VYLALAWFVLQPAAIWSPDEGAKLLQIKSLKWDNGRLTSQIVFPGQDIDPNLRFAGVESSRGLLRVQDGALYFGRLPTFTLLSAPLFRWLGVNGLYLLPALAGAACGILGWSLLEAHDRRLAMWLLIAFGSPIFIYSTLFWEHTLATSMGLAALWLALRMLRMGAAAPAPMRSKLAWCAVGLLFSMSIYLRLEMILFAGAALTACWLINRPGRRGIVWAGLAMLVALLPYFPLQVTLFHKVVPDNAAYLFYPLSYLMRAQWVPCQISRGPAKTRR
jgi:hypothetical protein